MTLTVNFVVVLLSFALRFCSSCYVFPAGESGRPIFISTNYRVFCSRAERSLSGQTMRFRFPLRAIPRRQDRQLHVPGQMSQLRGPHSVPSGLRFGRSRLQRPLRAEQGRLPVQHQRHAEIFRKVRYVAERGVPIRESTARDKLSGPLRPS